jgi:hypothetical protein
MSSVRRLIAMLAVAGIVGAAGSSAFAANVSGNLVTVDGKAARNRQIHFENRVTHDLFLIMTVRDGQFSIDLPPGSYDLRSDRGAIMGPLIDVDEADVALGDIVQRAGWRGQIFQREGVLKGILATPAPSTANIPPFPPVMADEAAGPAASSMPNTKPQVPLVDAPAAK